MSYPASASSDFMASIGQSTVQSIELILATGSKSGTPAPIQRGYYMIGRHAECQIRPKSRSVSRRHCLLHHGEHGLSVFDLRSTRGTQVNEEEIEPHSWVQLSDGDQIRCGKICFDVSIKQAVPVGVGQQASATEKASDAWGESDIAQFLEDEDDAERERRYGQIRQIRTNVGESTEEITVSGDLDAYEDTPLEKDDSTPIESDKGDSAKNKKKKKQKSKSPKIPRGKSRGPKKARAPLFSFSFGDGEGLKLGGAILLVVVFVGFLGYQIYNAASGPKIQVLEELD